MVGPITSASFFGFVLGNQWYVEQALPSLSPEESGMCFI
jgi:hypothetical protein